MKTLIHIALIKEIMFYNFLLLKRFALRFFKQALYLIIILGCIYFFIQFAEYVIQHKDYILSTLK